MKKKTMSLQLPVPIYVTIFVVAPAFIAGECQAVLQPFDLTWDVGDKPQRYVSIIHALYTVITAIFAVASGFTPDALAYGTTSKPSITV